VCGGLGDFLKMDPTVLRLIWVLVVIFTGFVPGVLIYIISIFVIPLEGTVTPPTPETKA
jgi:phage shock protein C